MSLEPGLELSILDSASPDLAIVHARCGPDLAVAKISLGPDWKKLVDFRAALDSGLRGDDRRPDSSQVAQFGRDLFAFLMQGDVNKLYQAVTTDDRRREMSVTVFSNCERIQDFPWEYIQEPNTPSGPGARAVVRLLPTVGLAPPAPAQKPGRVLFVSADPIATQTGVQWPEVEASLRHAFAAKVPGALNLTVVEGATQANIANALQTDTDVFHFCGHGEVRKDIGGGLILTGTPDFLKAETLASMLRGTPVRLAILSACVTSAGNRRDDFGVVADALIRAGVPAVVANQLPVPNASVAAFVGGLYAELLESGDIDRAVTKGRRALAFELSAAGEIGIEWGVPTLHRLVGGSVVYRR